MPPVHTWRISAGMREVVVRLVEEHVAEPSADDHAEDAVHEEVVDVRDGEPVVEAAADAIAAERHEGRRSRAGT
jgi:hypothetical protein